MRENWNLCNNDFLWKDYLNSKNVFYNYIKIISTISTISIFRGFIPKYFIYNTNFLKQNINYYPQSINGVNTRSLVIIKLFDSKTVLFFFLIVKFFFFFITLALVIGLFNAFELSFYWSFLTTLVENLSWFFVWQNIVVVFLSLSFFLLFNILWIPSSVVILFLIFLLPLLLFFKNAAYGLLPMIFFYLIGLNIWITASIDILYNFRHIFKILTYILWLFLSLFLVGPIVVSILLVLLVKLIFILAIILIFFYTNLHKFSSYSSWARSFVSRYFGDSNACDSVWDDLENLKLSMFDMLRVIWWAGWLGKPKSTIRLCSDIPEFMDEKINNITWTFNSILINAWYAYTNPTEFEKQAIDFKINDKVALKTKIKNNQIFKLGNLSANRYTSITIQQKNMSQLGEFYNIFNLVSCADKLLLKSYLNTKELYTYLPQKNIYNSIYFFSNLNLLFGKSYHVNNFTEKQYQFITGIGQLRHLLNLHNIEDITVLKSFQNTLCNLAIVDQVPLLKLQSITDLWMSQRGKFQLKTLINQLNFIEQIAILPDFEIMIDNKNYSNSLNICNYTPLDKGIYNTILLSCKPFERIIYFGNNFETQCIYNSNNLNIFLYKTGVKTLFKLDSSILPAHYTCTENVEHIFNSVEIVDFSTLVIDMDDFDNSEGFEV